MRPGQERPEALSVHRAFVVQLAASTQVEKGHLAGRVEHVVSHQSIWFESLEALLAFMARVLQEGQESPPRQPHTGGRDDHTAPRSRSPPCDNTLYRKKGSVRDSRQALESVALVATRIGGRTVTTPPAKAGGFLKKPVASAAASVPTHSPTAYVDDTRPRPGPETHPAAKAEALAHAGRVSVVSLLYGITFTNDPLSFNLPKLSLKEPHRMSLAASSD